MEKLDKYITDERTGLKYELTGDYYFITGDNEPENKRSIGIWGQRRLRYIKQNKRVLYTQLLLSGKLNDYLANINEKAEDMFFRLVKQIAEREGITEQIKANNQIEWIGAMNNICNRIEEIIMNELIYTA